MKCTVVAVLCLIKNSSYLNLYFSLYVTKRYILICIKYKHCVTLLYQSSAALSASNVLKSSVNPVFPKHRSVGKGAQVPPPSPPPSKAAVWHVWQPHERSM